MLSAIVLSPRAGADVPQDRASEAVVRTLAALVSAAIDDLVRDACIVGRADERLGKIADHAGCGLVENDDPKQALAAALRAARADHVLVLTGGYAPGYGFIEEMSDWRNAAKPQPVALRRESETLLQRLFPPLVPVAGVVGAKAACVELAAREPAALARALGARTLRTRARRLV